MKTNTKATDYLYKVSDSIPMQNIPFAVCRVMLDNDLSIISANNPFYALFGMGEASLSSTQEITLSELIPKRDYSKLRALITKNHSAKTPFEVTIKINRNNNTSARLRVRIAMSSGTADMFFKEDSEIFSGGHYSETSKGTLSFLYDLQKRQAVLSTDLAALLHLPETVENFEDVLVTWGRVSVESLSRIISFFESIRGDERSGSTVILLNDGTWLKMDFAILTKENSGFNRVLVNCADITEKREKEMAYTKWYQIYKSLDEKCFNYYEINVTNSVFERMEGEMIPVCNDISLITSREYIDNYVLPYVAEEDRERLLDFLAKERLIMNFNRNNTYHSCEIRLKNSANETFWVLITLQLLTDNYSDDIRASLLVKNIDREKSFEIEVLEKANYDVLTGVLNRASAVWAIKNMIQTCDAGTRHAILMLDIDHFKKINDKLGHTVGDKILQKVVRDIKMVLREGDIIGRMGGDEFIVCMKNMPNEDTMGIMEKRVNALRERAYHQLQSKVQVSISVGVAIFPDHGASFEMLYKKADTALYAAKANGKNTYMFYSEGLEEPKRKKNNLKKESSDDIEFLTEPVTSDFEYTKGEYDLLTGSPGYATFKKTVENSLSKKAPSDVYSMQVYMLKDFKFVTDIFGHDKADTILQRWAKFVASMLRDTETFTRINSDSFAVFSRFDSDQMVSENLTGIVNHLSGFTEIGGENILLEMSCGYFVIEDSSNLSIEEYLRNAKIACMYAKQFPGNTAIFYNETMNDQMLRDKKFESEMKDALSERQFKIFLQPQISVRNGRYTVEAAEALVRWLKIDETLILPGEFIMLFEKNGFIYQLDKYVLEEVCKFLRYRIINGKQPLCISMNVSKVTLYRSTFIADFKAIKEKYHIPSGILEIECSEVVFSSSAKKAYEILSGLQEQGFRISIDNFGTGGASLNLLKDMRVNKLKLDLAAFDSDISNPRNAAIISSVITMANQLNINVVAEGVENEKQMTALKQLGCDALQGHVFGKAFPAEDFDSQIQEFLKQPESGEEHAEI